MLLKILILDVAFPDGCRLCIEIAKNLFHILWYNLILIIPHGKPQRATNIYQMQAPMNKFSSIWDQVVQIFSGTAKMAKW